MERETKDYLNKYHMISPGDGILVALSGGADSVCLLYVLGKLKKELGVELRALHVHHGLRGCEADRDAEFSRVLCDSMGIVFYEERIDAAKEAKELGCSVEEAGRLARYRLLEQRAKNWENEIAYCSACRCADGINEPGDGFRVHIATAHHGGDSAETILLNLFRGSGLKGLGGIAPVRGRIIRPLLWTNHQQIMEYLRSEGISWVEDSSNGENEYVRNRIRNEILPAVAGMINEKAEEHILRAGAWIRQANQFFEDRAGLWVDENVSGGRIKAAALRSQDEILQGYIVRCVLQRQRYPLKDITAGHIRQILELADNGTGRKISLPHFLEVENVYGMLRFIYRREISEKYENSLCAGVSGESRDFAAGKSVPVSDFPGFHVSVFPCKNPSEFPKNQYTKWFDYDKIKDTLSVRHRLPGDYITLSSGGRKLLKAYMIDEKIPRDERGRLLLLAEGSHILWIVGLRISEYYKVTEETRTVLQVEFEEGADSG